ncbi:MAG: hypothetical protein RMM07_11920 [Anaerolineae bacterium]|nr:hypothetical protein [Anaerolineae bacterium]
MELSPLTMGETFDLELAAAWEKLFPGDPPPERLRLWVGRPDRGGEKA